MSDSMLAGDALRAEHGLLDTASAMQEVEALRLARLRNRRAKAG